jgi:hypothetical protein
MNGPRLTSKRETQDKHMLERALQRVYPELAAWQRGS